MKMQEMFACFHVGGIELAFSTKELQEVVAYPEKITPAAEVHPSIIGAFNLRGLMLPLIDVAVLLGLPSSAADSSRRIAVVRVGAARIGLCLDATSEIVTVNAENISDFDEPSEGPRAVLRRVLKLQGGDRIVEVFEAEGLLRFKELSPILSSSQSYADEESARKKGPRRQCITFQCNDTTMALLMSSIREIICLPKIQKTVLAIDYCLGMFNLRGMIVPIIDFRQFTLNQSRSISDIADSSRVMIVRVNQVQIGLLVDTVNSIESFYDEDLQEGTSPTSKLDAMTGAYVRLNDESCVPLLCENKILKDDEIKAICHGHNSLYGRPGGGDMKYKKISDRKMYLCFQLKYPLSTRLNSIEEIAIPEKDMICPPGSPDFVAGMLNVRGEMLMIVDLRAYYGFGKMTDLSNSRIIITRGVKGKYGFLVDSVQSIETVDESQKIKLPVFLAKDVINHLQGDMNEVVEMKDMSGTTKTFMILDIPELVRKIELKTA